MTAYEYTKLFDPKHVHRVTSSQTELGDRRARPTYVYDDDIVLAVNVALATGRPLLVRGASGTGKSTLARNAAHVLGRRFYEVVVTSRTQANDLLYEVDLLKRLNDAQAGRGSDAADPLSRDMTPYIKPGPLWWALDRENAEQLGTTSDPGDGPSDAPAAILIDEVDKADPDVPNNLLVPLGSLRFDVPDLPGRTVERKGDAPLVVITSNDERQLPAAFLRRCVELQLAPPPRARLEEIGIAHIGTRNKSFVRQALAALLGDAENDGAQPISPAEFVDVLEAARNLEIEVGSDAWRAIEGVTVWKHGRRARSGA